VPCLPVGEALDDELVDDVAQRPPEQVAAGHGAPWGWRRKKKLPETGRTVKAAGQKEWWEMVEPYRRPVPLLPLDYAV
jgi:hypothetical protein